jgi:hypothetical protein
MRSRAITCYDYALWLQPDAASTRWNSSLAYRQQGDYERGWAEYEWRWRRKRTRRHPFAQPAWDGAPWKAAQSSYTWSRAWAT